MAVIIVHGVLEVDPQHWEDAMRLALEHVERSRQEPGCISHAVHIDAENPNRLVFFEEWKDMDALQAHFALPASAEFVEQAEAMATARPALRVFESTSMS